MNRRHAGFLPRLGAFALDLIPILGYVLLLLGVGLALNPRAFSDRTGVISTYPSLFDFLAFLTVILPVVLYFTLQESSPKMASWGKRRMGLQVVTGSGARLDFGRALLRSAVKFLPWQIAHTSLFHIPGWPFVVQIFPFGAAVGFMTVYALLAIYLLTLLLKPHRTPYDRIAGTVVVDSKGK
jgi:uncharacterized RDD family membrane protein YckC